MLPYCSIIERKQKKTIDEMEQEFLQKAIMSNEELDNLKEELMWEGSSVVMLSNNRVHARMSKGFCKPPWQISLATPS